MAITEKLCVSCKGQLAEKQEDKPKAKRPRKASEPKVTKVTPKANGKKGELDFGKLREWAVGKLVWAPKQNYALALIAALENGEEIPARPGDLPESAAHKVELRLKITR